MGWDVKRAFSKEKKLLIMIVQLMNTRSTDWCTCNGKTRITVGGRTRMPGVATGLKQQRVSETSYDTSTDPNLAGNTTALV